MVGQPMRPLARTDLRARAEARWQQIAADQPDLVPAIMLQRQLLHEMFELAAEFENRTVSADTSPSQPLARLEAGIPLLDEQDVPIGTAEMRRALSKLCRILSGGGAEAASHIEQALDTGDIEPASLVRASLRRDQTAVRQAAVHLGLSPDLLWLVGELVASPLAVTLRHRLVERGGPSLASAFNKWNRGFCPACGSWPAFAEVLGQDRRLRCSFCGTAWTLARDGCIYCGEAGDQFVTAAPDLAHAQRRAELCSACGSYLKVVEQPEPCPSLLLAIEDLATTDLDVAAMHRGYARPSMRDARPAQDRPCG